MPGPTSEAARREYPVSVDREDGDSDRGYVGSKRNQGKGISFGVRNLCSLRRQRVTMHYRQRTTMVVECYFGRYTIPPKEIDEVVTIEEE